jgi:hypothetical protein
MEEMNEEVLYTLDIPNSEVKKAFLERLLEAYGKYSDKDVDVDKLPFPEKMQVAGWRS